MNNNDHHMTVTCSSRRTSVVSRPSTTDHQLHIEPELWGLLSPPNAHSTRNYHYWLPSTQNRPWWSCLYSALTPLRHHSPSSIPSLHLSHDSRMILVDIAPAMPCDDCPAFLEGTWSLSLVVAEEEVARTRMILRRRMWWY